jgi:hypothetical protein
VDQIDNVNGDYWVTVLVRVVAVRVVVKAVVRAQPAVRAAARMLNKANFCLQVSRADG